MNVSNYFISDNVNTKIGDDISLNGKGGGNVSLNVPLHKDNTIDISFDLKITDYNYWSGSGICFACSNIIKPFKVGNNQYTSLTDGSVFINIVADYSDMSYGHIKINNINYSTIHNNITYKVRIHITIDNLILYIDDIIIYTGKSNLYDKITSDIFYFNIFNHEFSSTNACVLFTNFKLNNYYLINSDNRLFNIDMKNYDANLDTFIPLNTSGDINSLYINKGFTNMSMLFSNIKPIEKFNKFRIQIYSL